MTDQNGKCMNTVKVGDKGQIVIPKEARALFGIQPGDTLMLLADIERGIAIVKLDYYQKLNDHMMGLLAQSEPEQEE